MPDTIVSKDAARNDRNAGLCYQTLGKLTIGGNPFQALEIRTPGSTSWDWRRRRMVGTERDGFLREIAAAIGCMRPCIDSDLPTRQLLRMSVTALRLLTAI